MNTFLIWQNPLVIRGVRSRLRPAAAISWAMVTVVVSTFIYIFFSENLDQHSNATAQEAAREAILPLMVMQGIILMVLGSGAVAGGMARERTYRLLDYQRLTPMTPTAKIVGMLFGLPIREYFMFALSLPFVFFAAWKGGLAFSVLFQFYLVFILSAIVFHMTGLAAGMVVGKPWQAGTLSQGLVVVLYLMLPQVSNFGFTFFEFLTARPVFYGMVGEHLLPESTREAILQGDLEATGNTPLAQILNIKRYQSVAFFGMTLSPVFFSLAVLGFALMTLYVIAYRKWQSESSLPFSKGFALLFFAVAQFFLIGSVLPLLASDELFAQLVRNYEQRDQLRDSNRSIVFAIFVINLSVSGCMSILAVYLCTPTWHQSVAGVRQILRDGRNRLAWNSDAASGLPVVAAFWLMSCLGFIAVYQTAEKAGRVAVENSSLELLLPMMFFVLVLITVQQIIEQFSERIFVMTIFMFWLVPVLTGIIIATAFNRPVAGFYSMIPFPFTELLFNVGLLMSDESTEIPRDIRFFIVRELQPHAWPIVMVSIAMYGYLAMMLLLLANRRWRRIYETAGRKPGISAKAAAKRSPASILPSSQQSQPATVMVERHETPRSS